MPLASRPKVEGGPESLYDGGGHGLSCLIRDKVEGNRGVGGVRVCIGGAIVRRVVQGAEGRRRGGKEREDRGVFEPGEMTGVFIR